MSTGITAEGAVLEVNTGTIGAPVWTPIIERSRLQMRKTGESIDMTTFDDQGFRGRRPGLRDTNIDASGNYVPSDTGYQALEDAWLAGDPVHIRGLWDDGAGGQVGWQFDNSVITDLGELGNVGDKVELSMSFEGSGPPTKVTL